ncbi:Hypothetical predicted protein [Mytilus galloprovincialis]|uniref:SUEL-type lectin domain-containing protein n=2 Tax=Mytilus galloprovincialis TaxID=29158 RepID=A0A8B6FIZ2_MYTGA|nr:Hypothetical predicted protein [Mytilus galloprovincialis]
MMMRPYLTVVLVLLSAVAVCSKQAGIIKICEGRSSNITCSGGTKIHIMKAIYGRTEKDVCPSKAIKTTSCLSGYSTCIVKAKCNGKSSCLLKASNDVFGDPCKGTYKYLEVEHICR